MSEVWRMQIELAEPLEVPCPPPGIAVRTYEPADAAAVHALLQRAFEGSHETVLPFEEWLPWMTEDAAFDPTVWFLADSDGGLAGVALCWNNGFVKDLAVDPGWRRRGLGEALLHQVFREFFDRGCRTVALKVDAANPTGAVRLYKRIGMRIESRSARDAGS
jgi:ribosomal protein S18 acetylase RimI-like enzyme